MERTFLMVGVLLFAGCGEHEKKTNVPIEPESRPAKLMTVSVSGSVNQRTFPAIVVADDSAVLTFRVSGQLKDMPVKAGMNVEEGQVLAVLDPQELALRKAQAQAAFNLAKVQFDRAAKLRKDFVVSEQDYDQAQSRLNEAKANLDQADANLSYTTLRAPYEGAISLRYKENYEYVTANEPVMNIQTNDIVNVSFQLPEHLINRLSGKSENEQADVVFDTYPSRSFVASLKQIDTEADPKTGSYQVTLTMPRPDNINVLPGMSANVHVEVDANSSSMVPKTALVDNGDGTTRVWKVGVGGWLLLFRWKFPKGWWCPVFQTGIKSYQPGSVGSRKATKWWNG